jgi:hypothetical protein
LITSIGGSILNSFNNFFYNYFPYLFDDSVRLSELVWATLGKSAFFLLKFGAEADFFKKLIIWLGLVL